MVSAHNGVVDFCKLNRELDGILLGFIKISVCCLTLALQKSNIKELFSYFFIVNNTGLCFSGTKKVNKNKQMMYKLT